MRMKSSENELQSSDSILSRRMLFFVTLLILYNIVCSFAESEYSVREITPAVIGHIFLSAVVPFTGGYQPMPGQPDIPSAWISFGIFFSFMTTVITVLSLLATQVRFSLRRRLIGKKVSIVIIGDGGYASTIVSSARSDAKISLLHFTHSPSLRNRWEILWNDHPETTINKPDSSVLKAISQAKNVIIATGSDTGNIKYARLLHKKLQEAKKDNTTITCMISDPHLTEQLRPAYLEKTLPKIELFSPEENIAQHATEIISDLALSGEGSILANSKKIKIFLYQIREEENRGALIQEWLERLQHAYTFIEAAPEILLVDNEKDADVIFIVGPETSVAAQALQMTKGNTDLQNKIWIAFTHQDLITPPDESQLIPTVSEVLSRKKSILHRGELIVADANAIASDYNQVTSGLKTQWGRAYHIFYSFMTHKINEVNKREVPLWDTNHGKKEQSSIAAVENMLILLNEHHYELMHVDPDIPKEQLKEEYPVYSPSSETINSIAEAEHNAWRERKWIDFDGTLRRVVDKEPGDGVNDIDFEELPQEYQEYNRMTVKQAFPAIAATFGYVIQPKGSGPHQ